MRWAFVLKIAAVCLFEAGCAHTPSRRPLPFAVHKNESGVTTVSLPDGTSTSLGTLEKNEVDQVFRENWLQVTTCYRNAQAGRPFWSGHLRLLMLISPQGAVSALDVFDPEETNIDFNECLAKQVTGGFFLHPRAARRSSPETSSFSCDESVQVTPRWRALRTGERMTLGRPRHREQSPLGRSGALQSQPGDHVALAQPFEKRVSSHHARTRGLPDARH
jgi:hypothetical protein